MKIAIIGGGAAGMMAAATVGENSDHEIHIFEKNNLLGNKVIISGGGRCNVTTGLIKKSDLQHKYIRGRDWLQHAMSQFGPRKMRQRVEAHGVPLKCEDDLRVFPKSDNGKDIVGMFEKVFHASNVKIHFKEGAESLSYKEGVFTLTTKQGVYTFDKVLISTGGNAYAHTGSTGDGYDLAKQCGHTITPLGPSLNSFLIQEERTKPLSGISFREAAISYSSAKVIGPALLTHFGVSGPAVFAFSAHSAFEAVEKATPLLVRLQPYADKNRDRWIGMLNDNATSSPKKQINTIIGYEFPDRFADALLNNLGILTEKKIADLTREEKQLIASTLGDGIPLSLIARRPGDEFVTAGGVNTDEVNKDTMESTLCPGLYFAGEVLNVDGVTGGYNLQACRATGYAAGKAMSV